MRSSSFHCSDHNGWWLFRLSWESFSFFSFLSVQWYSSENESIIKSLRTSRSHYPIAKKMFIIVSTFRAEYPCQLFSYITEFFLSVLKNMTQWQVYRNWKSMMITSYHPAIQRSSSCKNRSHRVQYVMMKGIRVVRTSRKIIYLLKQRFSPRINYSNSIVSMNFELDNRCPHYLMTYPIETNQHVFHRMCHLYNLCVCWVFQILEYDYEKWIHD